MGDFVKWNLNITAEHMDPYLVTDELYGTFGDQPGYFGYTHDCTKRSMLSEHGYPVDAQRNLRIPELHPRVNPFGGGRESGMEGPPICGGGGGIILSRVGL